MLALERRLVAKSRSRGSLRVALSRFAARAVQRRIWEPLGYARLADYARECLGISGREVQDLAKTGSRLELLPAIEAALRRGEIPWSKARLIARVATPDDEAAWVAYAHRVTATALEGETRRVDVGSLEGGAVAPLAAEADEDVPSRGVRIACTDRVASKWFRVRQMARRVAGRSLSLGECTELFTAEVLSAIPLEESAPEDSWEDDRTPPRRGREEEAPATPSDELPPFEIPSVCLDGLDETDPRKLHFRLRDLVLREQRLGAEIGELLVVIADRRIYRALGFATQEAYAKERLGISGRKVRALLRIERAARRCPTLAAGYRTGRLSSVQAEALVPLVYADPAERWIGAWIERAGRVTVRRLRDDVEHAMLLVETDLAKFAETGGLPPEPGSAADSLPTDSRQLCANASAPEEHCQAWFQGPQDFIQLFRALLATVRRRIERSTGSLPTQGQALEAMLDHALQEWDADAPVRREHRVFERDGWRCRVPGCSSRRSLHAHHVLFRSAGGGNELSNLVTLCAWHHLRGIHTGIVRCTGKAPHELRFVLPLQSYGSGEVLTAPQPSGP